MSICTEIFRNHLGNKVPFTFAVEFIRVVTTVIGAVADFVAGNAAAVGARLEALPTASVLCKDKGKHKVGLTPHGNSLTLMPKNIPEKYFCCCCFPGFRKKNNLQKLLIYYAA